MGNEESRKRLEEEKKKRFHHEEFSDSNAPEEYKSKWYRRMNCSRKRSKTSYEVSRSWSRSPERGRRARSHSSRRSQSRNKMKDIETTYSEYYCKDCDCNLSGKVSWNQHIVGRRHAKNTERRAWESHTSKKRKLIEPEVNKREHDYFPKKKPKSDERKPNYVCDKKLKRYENVQQNLMETDHEDNNYVGLDYVLVVHKHDKSVFHCFLCDTFYKNSQQLKDHVLGVDHQRAFKEEKNKGLIKIKRLKSRNPGKHSLEQLVEKTLFASNTTERITKKSCDVPRDRGRDSRLPSNSISIPKSFLRKTLEEVQLHNRKYELKMTSTAFCPERKLSTPASESVFSKNSTPSRYTTVSPSPLSTVSVSPFNDVASLQNSISSPVPSTKSENILELVEILPTIEILKLLLLKLKNVEVKEQDLPFLEEVADVTTDLSKKLKKQLGTTSQTEPEVLFLEEVSANTTSLSKNYKKQFDFTLQKNNMNVQKSTLPLPLLIGSNNCTTGEDVIEIRNPALPANTQILEENSTVPAIMNQVDQPIQPPAAFWNSLPSTQDLENILINLPNVNLSKNSDGILEIQLN